MNDTANANSNGQRRLLLVDDDLEFCSILSSAMERRGFKVAIAHDARSALDLAAAQAPQFAIIDLNLNGSSGLALIEKLTRLSPRMRILVLTGFATIGSAVHAVKSGAHDYLTKPASAEDIAAALLHESEELPPPPAQGVSADDLELQHLKQVLTETNGNVTEAARLLGMNRRTVYRKLSKRPGQK